MIGRKWSVVMLLGILALSGSVVVRADESAAPAADSKEHSWDAKKMQKKLGLTDDQVTKLNAVRDAEKSALKPSWDKQKDLMKKLKDQIANKAADSDIQATLSEIKANRKAMADQMEQFRSQREGILTPTQQAQMLLHRMKHRRMLWHKEGDEK